MADDKQNLIAALEEIAVLMELRGENPFHSRAYENGARALAALEGQPEDWLRDGTLEHTRGIGKGMAEKVAEWIHTGRLKQLDALRREIPAGLLQMLGIPGLGPKKIKAIYDKLKITTLEQLETAAREGTLAELPSFGQKTAENILEGILHRREYGARHLLDEATETAERVLARLRPLQQSGVIRQLEVGGQPAPRPRDDRRH